MSHRVAWFNDNRLTIDLNNKQIEVLWLLNKAYMKAIWNNEIIAESDDTIVVENNHYFPPDSVNKNFLKSSSTHTTCHWKGQASYYSIEVAGKQNKDAAWFYPSPKPAAENIKDYIAFWKGVQITK